MTTYRNPSHPAAFLMILAAAFMLTNVFVSEAQAKPRHRQNIDVSFDELDARVVRGKLQVTYEIDRHDWRKLQRLHIRPRLNVYTPARPGQFTYATSAELNRRDAKIIFPHHVTPADWARNVEVRLSGDRKRVKIATTSYQGTCGSRVRVALQNRRGKGHRGRGHGHGHGHGHGGRNDVAIINACNAQTTWSGDLNTCIKKAQGLGYGAPAVVNACGASTSWSGDFFDCLDLSNGVRSNKVGVIKACDNATSWSGEFETCLKSAASYRADAAPTINACKAATSWSGDFNDCMSAARPLGHRAPRVVDACDAATSWSGEFKQCLAAARRS